MWVCVYVSVFVGSLDLRIVVSGLSTKRYGSVFESVNEQHLFSIYRSGYVYEYVYVCLGQCICVCVYVYMCMCMCVCVYYGTCMYVFVFFICMYLHVCV